MTGMYVTLEEAKTYLGIYYTEKDAEIAMAIEASEQHWANFIDRPLADLATSENSPPDLDASALKENAKLAILNLVHTLVNEKGTIVSGTIVSDNRPVENMMHFERKGLGV